MDDMNIQFQSHGYLRYISPQKIWYILHINWCRISSINSTTPGVSLCLTLFSGDQAYLDPFGWCSRVSWWLWRGWWGWSSGSTSRSARRIRTWTWNQWNQHFDVNLNFWNIPQTLNTKVGLEILNLHFNIPGICSSGLFLFFFGTLCFDLSTLLNNGVLVQTLASL